MNAASHAWTSAWTWMRQHLKFFAQAVEINGVSLLFAPVSITRHHPHRLPHPFPPGYSVTMSARIAHLLPALLLGSFLVAPAFAAPTTHHTYHHRATSHGKKESALIWRGDVTTGQAVVNDIEQAWAHTGHPRIVQQPFNTASGLDAVAAGTADLAGSARPSDGSPEDSHLTFTPVAWDALVMITNPANPVHNLTLRQLHEIYFGRITNWKEVGGNDAPINLYSVFSPNDGVEYSLRSLLYGRGNQQISAPRLYLNTDALQQGVALNPNALGLSTLSNVAGNPKLRTIPIDGVSASLATITDGSYPLYIPLYLVSNPSNPKIAAVKDFINFLQGDKAAAILRSHYVLPFEDGIALVAKDQARRDRVYAEATDSKAKPPTAAPIVAPDVALADAAAALAATKAKEAEAKPTAATSAGSGTSAGGAANTYTVVKGDTLSGIAQKKSVTVADLRDWNHLKNDNIRLGQTLQVRSD